MVEYVEEKLVSFNSALEAAIIALKKENISINKDTCYRYLSGSLDIKTKDEYYGIFKTMPRDDFDLTYTLSIHKFDDLLPKKKEKRNITFYGKYDVINISDHYKPRPEELEKDLKSILPNIIRTFLDILCEYKLDEDETSLMNYLINVPVRFSPDIVHTTYSQKVSIELIKQEYDEIRRHERDLNLNGFDRDIIGSLGNIIPLLDNPERLNESDSWIFRDLNNPNDTREISPIVRKLLDKILVTRSVLLGEYNHRKNYITLFSNAIRSSDMNKYYQVYAHEIFHALHFYFIRKKHRKFVYRKSYDSIVEGLASFFEYLFVNGSLHRDEYANKLMISWETDPELWPYSYARNFYTNRPHLYLYSLMFLSSIDKMKDAVTTIKQMNEVNKQKR